MFTVKLLRSYKKINSKAQLITVFVYTVHGTEEQLANYKQACGDHYRESDDQVPLWFSTKFIGQSGKILITSNDKIVPDTSQFDQAASLASQYGGNLGQALANQFAAMLVGTPAPQVQTEQPVTPDDKLD